MRIIGKKAFFLLVPLLLAGCVLVKPTPTPLALLRTAPPGTGTPAPAATATLQTNVPSTAQGPVEQQIALESPQEGDAVGNPLAVRGTIAVMPFEGTLVVRIYDAHGTRVTESPIMVQGDYGGPGTFDAVVAYPAVSGAGRVEVVEVSPYDGATLAVTGASVTFSGPVSGGVIEVPAASERVTLPLRVLAHVGHPGDRVTIALMWEDGTLLEQPGTLLAGHDGRGLLFTALDWTGEPHPAHPPSQRATLLVRDESGQSLAQQPVTVLHPGDPETSGVSVYWVRGDAVEPQSLRIPRTPGVGRAALEALLWGPVPGNPAGYGTALPLPEEVVAYSGGPGWGERVRLNKLIIEAGVAHADFSRELLANPGGAARMTLIRQQIEQTLLQFSTVDRVIITVEGQTGLLEP